MEKAIAMLFPSATRWFPTPQTFRPLRRTSPTGSISAGTSHSAEGFIDKDLRHSIKDAQKWIKVLQTRDCKKGSIKYEAKQGRDTTALIEREEEELNQKLTALSSQLGYVGMDGDLML